MFLFITSASRLAPKIKKALQNGEYTTEEVGEIQKEVNMHRQVKQKGFKRALIIVACIFVLIVALSVSQLRSLAFLFAMLITGVIMAVIMVFVKWFYVDAVQRQFIKEVQKGYPDYLINRQ
jgi:antibiotic biosynthesis monooxygenase (ABM) superfamily enzyme